MFLVDIVSMLFGFMFGVLVGVLIVLWPMLRDDDSQCIEVINDTDITCNEQEEENE